MLTYTHPDNFTDEGVNEDAAVAVDYLIDGTSGVYIPQRFALEWAHAFTYPGLEYQYDADVAILAQGPYTDGYWDAWDAVLRGAQATDEATDADPSWRGAWLYQDDGLYIMRDEHPGERADDADIMSGEEPGRWQY